MRNARRGGRVALAIHRCRKMTIAAINGAAVGVCTYPFYPHHVHLPPYSSHMSSESSRCASSALSFPRQISSRIRYVLVMDVWLAIWVASAMARGSTDRASGSTSWNREPKCGEDAENTLPVVARYLGSVSHL